MRAHHNTTNGAIVAEIKLIERQM